MRPPVRQVRNWLHYDPITGWFLRKQPSGTKGKVGDLAGKVKADGYVHIGFAKHRERAHRLAFVIMMGRWPSEMDHKNGNRSDNRWCNLRECTRQQNNGNRTVQRKYVHHDLPRGVIRLRNRGGSISYNGRITVNNKQIHLGAYRTPDQAHAAYVEAAKRYFGEFARTS